jgi:hypothetical protein
VNEFGDERIEPAIEGSDYLMSRIPAHFVRTKKLKRIGRGWVYFRGAKSRSTRLSRRRRSRSCSMSTTSWSPSIVGAVRAAAVGRAADGQGAAAAAVRDPAVPGRADGAALQGERSARVAGDVPELRRGAAARVGEERALDDAAAR